MDESGFETWGDCSSTRRGVPWSGFDNAFLERPRCLKGAAVPFELHCQLENSAWLLACQPAPPDDL